MVTGPEINLDVQEEAQAPRVNFLEQLKQEEARQKRELLDNFKMQRKATLNASPNFDNNARSASKYKKPNR